MNIAKIVTVCAAWGVLALVSCGKLVATDGNIDVIPLRSEEHTSELQSQR